LSPEPTPKIAAVFAHYNRHDLVADYVFQLLDGLQQLGADILFVSTSAIDPVSEEKLGKICVKVHQRPNVGGDILGYAYGVDYFAGGDYDELILCNDSVYGPFRSLGPIFGEMRSRGLDFWGMTESYDVAPHVQSYFVVLGRRILEDPRFVDFWAWSDWFRPKTHLIYRYEVGLTQQLLQWGYRYETYVDQAELLRSAGVSGLFVRMGRARRMTVEQLERAALYSQRIPMRIWLAQLPWRILARLRPVWGVRTWYDQNSTHSLHRELMEKFGFPFLKIELINENPLAQDIYDLQKIIRISFGSDADFAPIQEHQREIRIGARGRSLVEEAEWGGRLWLRIYDEISCRWQPALVQLDRIEAVAPIGREIVIQMSNQIEVRLGFQTRFVRDEVYERMVESMPHVSPDRDDD